MMTMTYTCTVETPLGAMTAAADEQALTGLWFVGQKHYPARVSEWTTAPDHPVFAALRRQLHSYFEGGTTAEELQLAPQGSPFQKAVWDALRRIPLGETVTYGDIAREMAGARGLDSMSAQAVGGAVGRNPISILIPCHRVVGRDGSLTGYAGGLDRKETLLRLERGGDVTLSSRPACPPA
jgi:methylated-DNA-[protein]-cysteine S-methyltransferase